MCASEKSLISDTDFPQILYGTLDMHTRITPKNTCNTLSLNCLLVSRLVSTVKKDEVFLCHSPRDLPLMTYAPKGGGGGWGGGGQH